MRIDIRRGGAVVAALFAAGVLVGCAQETAEEASPAPVVTAANTKTAVISVTSGMT